MEATDGHARAACGRVLSLFFLFSLLTTKSICVSMRIYTSLLEVFVMTTRLSSFRLPPDVCDKLAALAELTGLSRTQYLVSVINSAYAAYVDNEELQSLVSQLNSVKSQVDSFFGIKPAE